LHAVGQSLHKQKITSGINTSSYLSLLSVNFKLLFVVVVVVVVAVMLCVKIYL